MTLRFRRSRTGTGWDPVPFVLLWIGQSASAFGTLLTNFGIVLWIWARTGQALPIAMIEFCSFGAVVLLGPFAGAVCDRCGPLRTLVASNLAAGGLLTGLLLLAATGTLTTPWVYAALVVLGAALAFQYPAMLAAVTSLVPRGHLSLIHI